MRLVRDVCSGSGTQLRADPSQSGLIATELDYFAPTGAAEIAPIRYVSKQLIIGDVPLVAPPCRSNFHERCCGHADRDCEFFGIL
jgi:hypothetical protein